MSRTTFIRHHITKLHYYAISFFTGYALGFVNGYFGLALPYNQALSSSFIYAIGLAFSTILGFEIGRNVKK